VCHTGLARSFGEKARCAGQDQIIPLFILCTKCDTHDMDLVATPSSPPPSRAWRALGLRLLLVAAVVVPVGGGFALLAQWPLWVHDPVLAGINVLVTITFLMTAALLSEEPGQRTTAWALALAGVFYSLSWVNEWNVGPLPLIASVLGLLSDLFGAWALLRYPESRLRRWYDRGFVLVALVWLVGGPLVLALTSLPSWHQFNPAAWWPSLFPNRELFAAATRVFDVGAILLAVCFSVLLLLRLWQLRGVERHVALPVMAAAVAAGIFAGVVMVSEVASLPDAAMSRVFAVDGLVWLAVPGAFLVAVLQRRLLRSRVADVVLRVTGPVTVETIREILRDAVRDPSLEVLYWVSEYEVYADPSGRRVDPPPTTGGRLAVAVRANDGAPLALVLADPALEAHRGLVDAAVAACGLALENARLLVQVRASRMRILEAGWAERRRVERDLHDGAQQQLLAVGTSLGVARSHAEDARDAAAVDAIDDARDLLHDAQRQLRELARGIHPPALRDHGLRAAIREVASRLPLRVDLDVPAVRFPRAVEEVAYFVVCEALANTVKYASAQHVTIRAHTSAGMLQLDITDDGKGGADPTLGTGLAGLADRVETLGGQLRVVSSRVSGTLISARIPCE
jgi:signal transduction histidine kinase